MPENWKTYKLKNICEKISVGFVGTISNDYTGEKDGVPILRSKNVRSGKIDYNDLKFVNKTFHLKNKKSRLIPGDIVIVRVGQNRGDVCKVPDTFPELNVANCVFLRPPKEYSSFLEILLRSVEGRNLLLSISSGSAQLVLNTGDIAELEVLLPEKKEALAIAEIINSFDLKIELNLQMNKTLEEMAMALYKHWFVDYGPFQDGEFEATELGEIPKGWEVKPINNIVKIFKKSYKPQDNPDLDFLHYSIPAFDKGKMPVEEKGSEMKSNKTLLNSDRILVSKLNPRFPRIWTVFYRESEEIGVTSPEFINYEVKKSDDWSYANFLFRENGFYSKFHENATGSTGSRQRVQPNLTLQFICPIPPANIRREFHLLVNPMLQQIDENLLENQTLTQLRDTLLPKLISGEVRVKDAEKTLSEVL